MSDSVNDYDSALTDEDIRDLIELGADIEGAITHSVLETWKVVLEDNIATKDGRITPGLAHRIVSTWPKLNYSDVPAYLARYYQILEEFHAVVARVVDENPKALELVLQDDAEDNHDLYIEVIGHWQGIAKYYELTWSTFKDTAAVDLAAQDDANSYTLNPTEGLLAHLGVIGFAFREEDNPVIQALAETHLPLED